VTVVVENGTRKNTKVATLERRVVKGCPGATPPISLDRGTMGITQKNKRGHVDAA
jgi:hypothetical protein